MEHRRLWIQNIRPLDHRPLEPKTIQADPLLNRGLILINGRDLDKLSPRSFYLESMDGLELQSWRPYKRPEKFAVAIVHNGTYLIVHRELTRIAADAFVEAFNQRPGQGRAVIGHAEKVTEKVTGTTAEYEFHPLE